WITFNGEIFNYIELLKQLIESGHRFTTESHTEVILRMYAENGERCVEDSIAQWAFAIWDASRQKLFLSRDRLGVPPLFFAKTSARFVFASEIKSLLKHPEIQRDIDVAGLDQIFTFWCTLPGRTVFK